MFKYVFPLKQTICYSPKPIKARFNTKIEFSENQSQQVCVTLNHLAEFFFFEP